MNLSKILTVLESLALEQLVGLLLTSTGVCLAGWVAAKLAYRCSAAFRSDIWRAVGVSILATFALLFLFPGIPLFTRQPAVHPIHSDDPVEHPGIRSSNIPGKPIVAELNSIETADSSMIANSELMQIPSSSNSPFDHAIAGQDFRILPWLTIVWSIGCVILLTRLIGSIAHCAWIVYHASAVSAGANGESSCKIDDQWRRLVGGRENATRLVLTPAISIPYTIGFWRSAIVLPECALSWSETKLQAVMAHEWAHVCRRDVAWHWLFKLTTCLVWFNPLVWLALKEFVQERERACDDDVLDSGFDACDYAESLVEIAAMISGRAPLISPSAVSMAEPPLKQRIRWILDAKACRLKSTRTQRTALAVCALVFACVSGMVRPFAVVDSLAQEKSSSIDSASSSANGQSRSRQSSDEVEKNTEPKVGLATTQIRGIVVDEQGNSVANALVTTLPILDLPAYSTTSKPNGTFLLRFPENLGSTVFSGDLPESFLVQDPEGKRASFVSQSDRTLAREYAYRIVLRPWRQTKVRVVNLTDEPVENAQISMIAGNRVLAKSITDTGGQANLRFPADAKVSWIVGLKDGEGLDYYENYPKAPLSDQFDVPDEVVLRLTGAISVSVMAKNSNQEPVPDCYVTPRRIHLPDKLYPVYFLRLHDMKTDNQGRIEFRWVPKNLKSSISFSVYHSKYYFPGEITYRRTAPEHTSLSANLHRVGTIRGQVVHADGSPAVGIRILAEGNRGRTFRGQTSTRSDGTYEIDVAPNQPIILAITEVQFAAASKHDIMLFEGEVKENVNFRLGPGTLLTGKVTFDPNSQRSPNHAVALGEQGTGITTLRRFNLIDSNGRYQFRVGPGNFLMAFENAQPSIFTITDEAEVKLDILPLSGLVLDMDANPVAGAQLMGEWILGFNHNGFRAKTGADGKYSIQRWNEALPIYAYHEQRGLAGFLRVATDARTANIRLTPAATVAGTAIDANGKPRANQPIQLSLHSPDASGFAGRIAVTNELGKFEFAAIQLDISHEIVTSLNDRKPTTFKATEAKRYELPPIVIQ